MISRHPTSSERSRSAKAAIWFMRVEQNRLSSRSRKWFTRWMAEPLNRQAFLAIANKWFASDPRALRALFRRERIKAPRHLTHLSLLAAVIGVLMFLAAVQMSFESRREPTTILTRADESRTRTLDDGSTVHVGPGSLLAVEFRPKQRLVHLTRGEAVFDVARDPQRPFVVLTKTLQVTAIGTRFSVRRDEQQSSVIVYEGIVTVSVRGSERGFTYTLRAGDAFDLPDERPQGGLASMPVRDGWLAFSNVGELVADFNRRNAIQINIASPEIAATTGRLTSDSADSVARARIRTDPLPPNRVVTVSATNYGYGPTADSLFLINRPVHD